MRAKFSALAANSASVWLAPPEMDSPGAGVDNGVGVGAALKAALKGRFQGPFKGRNTAASADQLVVMRNYGIFGERRNFFRPPLRGAIHTEAPLLSVGMPASSKLERSHLILIIEWVDSKLRQR